MELGGIPSKNDEYFHWGPIFYVCSFARNRVPFMYNYYIRNSLWVEAILDIWSSQTGTFQQKNRSPEMIIFLIYWIKKMSFSSSPKGIPHDRCRDLWKCEGFMEKMKKRIWKKWRIWLKRENNLYGKESVWQNMVNWRICMEKSWICLETWKKLYGKNMEKWRICIEMWRIY